MAVVKKFKNGEWMWEASYYDYGPDNRLNKRKRKYFTTKGEGEAWVKRNQPDKEKHPKQIPIKGVMLNGVPPEILTGFYVPPQKPQPKTVLELAEQYFSWAGFLKTKVTTQKVMRRRVMNFANWCLAHGYAMADQITTNVAMLYEVYAMSTWKGKGIESNLIAASTIFKRELMNDDSLLTKNPFRVVKKSGHFKKPKVKYVGWDVWQALFNCMTIFDQHMFNILFRGGLRSGELLNMIWTKIRGNVIEVTPHDGWTPKVSDAPAVVTLPADAMPSIHFFRLRTGDQKYVLLGSRPAGKHFLRRRLRATIERARIVYKDSNLDFSGITPHSFRKAYTTFLRESGLDLIEVQEMARHKSEKTTKDHYIALDTRKLTERADKLPPMKIDTYVDTKKDKSFEIKPISQKTGS